MLPTDPLFTLLPSRSHGECISKILNSAFLPSKFHSFDGINIIIIIICFQISRSQPLWPVTELSNNFTVLRIKTKYHFHKKHSLMEYAINLLMWNVQRPVTARNQRIMVPWEMDLVQIQKKRWLKQHRKKNFSLMATVILLHHSILVWQIRATLVALPLLTLKMVNLLKNVFQVTWMVTIHQNFVISMLMYSPNRHPTVDN